MVRIGKIIASGLLASVFLVPGAAAAAPEEKQAPAPPASLPEWNAFVDALRPAGDAAIREVYQPSDPQSRADTLAILIGDLSRGYLAEIQGDPDYPEFLPLYNSGYNIAAPNPDYVYYGTPMSGGGVYRLRGLIGTNRFTFLQFTGRSDDKAGIASGVLGGFALNEIKAAADGTFELILSAERPQGYTGNWQKLDPRTTSVFMRAASYDWLKERDPVVGIERLDRPARRPRQKAGNMGAKLLSLAEFVKKDGLIWWRHMADLQKRGLWNKIGIEPWGTFPGQVYLEGMYRLKDDEALILETEVPKNCRYWSFLVGDMQFRTIDWTNNQSSLNGFQAKIDADGKFRAVIAKRDPGVPNWLDTGDYSEGVIQGRWNVCDSAPVPTVTVVKLADLRKSLPKGTPTVTVEERDTQLRDRRLGAQMRRKW